MNIETKRLWRGLIEDYARRVIARLPMAVNEYFKACYREEFGEPVKTCQCNEAHRDAAIRLVARWRDEENATVSKMETATNSNEDETKSEKLQRPIAVARKRANKPR